VSRHRSFLVVAAAFMSTTMAGACSLLVGTDGLSDGAAALADGAQESSVTPDAVDAPRDTTAPPSDASRDADAESDADASPIATAYVAAVLADAPIAYLRLEEAAGAASAKNEVAGPGGSYSPAAELGVDGAFVGSNGARFDGSPGGISLGTSRGFAGHTPFSIELWFRPDANDATFRFLASAYEDVDAGRESFGIYMNTTYGLVAERYVANVALATAPLPAIATGAYHHFVMRYDGATLSLYVDGALAADVSDARASLASAPELVIGAFGGGSASVLGTIDELAVYDKALAAARILAHYHASGR
jgi:hypothetical protein